MVKQGLKHRRCPNSSTRPPEGPSAQFPGPTSQLPTHLPTQQLADTPTQLGSASTQPVDPDSSASVSASTLPPLETTETYGDLDLGGQTNLLFSGDGLDWDVLMSDGGFWNIGGWNNDLTNDDGTLR
jgi:hypothetical protein